MEESGLLFIVSGPSGSGKSTLCKALVDLIPNLNFSVSYTTRAPRKGETAGKDYNFVSAENFKEMIAAGEFAEWAEVFGYLYGTPRSSIEQALKQVTDLLFDIDCQGAKQLKKIYPQAVTVFILPPSTAELEKRLGKRETDSSKDIQKRLERSREEMNQAKDYMYIIINDIFAQALQTLHSIAVAENHRRERMEKYLENVHLS